MGNVKSFCCREDTGDADDREERSRILNDNYNESCDDLRNSSTPALSNRDSVSYGSLNHGNNSKSQEQSALDKIYQRMASNVIDVAPGESMVIQPAEFLERQKAYQAKLNQIKTPLPLRVTNRLPKHVDNSTDTTMNTTSPSFNSSNLTGTTNIQLTGNTLTNVSQYSAGIASTSTNSNSPQHLNKSQTRRRVEYEPISQEETELIKEISRKTVQAIRNLKVESDEQVVTQFRP